MAGGNELNKCMKLLVASLFPGSADFENTAKSVDVGLKIGLQRSLEVRGLQPFEAPLLGVGVIPIDLSCLLLERGKFVEENCCGVVIRIAILARFKQTLDSIGIGIFVRHIKQFRILRADGHRQFVFQCIQVHQIAHDVSLQGLDESRTAALKALEKVRFAETHQPNTGTSEPIHDGVFRRRRRMRRVGVEIVRQAIARER